MLLAKPKLTHYLRTCSIQKKTDLKVPTMTSPLTDLDELVLLCRDERAKAYLREAVASYRVGAFRAAIVATWIAVCFDFIEKLQELALAGDKEAEEQVVKLEKIRSSGDITSALKFERGLLTVARDKFEFISPLEFIDLEHLQEDRNRCAHPSLIAEGQAYNPSAELARFHISSAVRKVLQHPPAQGKYALDRLIKEVASDYFPTTAEAANEYLSTGPLRKARDSLVRNFIIHLLKYFILENSDYQYKRRISASLQAIAALHPIPYTLTLTEKLSPILRQIEDSALFSTLNFFTRVPDCWQFLDDDLRQKLINYVSDMPTDHFEHIESALEISELKNSAEARIKKATKNEISSLLYLDPPVQISDRFIDIYLDSTSFQEANSWAEKMMSYSSDFTEDQVRRILNNISKNNQLLESRKIGPLIKILRNQKILLINEFENLLRNNGLEAYIDEL